MRRSGRWRRIFVVRIDYIAIFVIDKSGLFWYKTGILNGVGNGEAGTHRRGHQTSRAARGISETASGGFRAGIDKGPAAERDEAEGAGQAEGKAQANRSTA